MWDPRTFEIGGHSIEPLSTYVTIFLTSLEALHSISSYVYVTVRVKTSLVHTSKFATSMACNFCWERHTESMYGCYVPCSSTINM